MNFVNVANPNLVVEYLRVLVDNDPSFDTLRALIADKSYALSVGSTMAYSEITSIVSSEVMSMAMRGVLVDNLIAWVNSLNHVEELYDRIRLRIIAEAVGVPI